MKNAMPSFPEWFSEIQKCYPVWGCTCHELRARQEPLQRLRRRTFADGTHHFVVVCTGCHKTSALVQRALVPPIYHDEVPQWVEHQDAVQPPSAQTSLL